jgi:hypothetical protein
MLTGKLPSLPTNLSEEGQQIVSAITEHFEALNRPGVLDITDAPIQSDGFKLGGWISVMRYGARGDGTTDDLAAVTAAFAAIPNGGVVYFPPGTYALSSRISLPTNTRLQGAGAGVTFLKNTGVGSPNNIAIDIRGVVGTAYPVNAVTEGAATVTTTTAANAGNFSVDEKIAVAGAFTSGDYYPFFITTVTSVNAATGVIGIKDKARRTGAYTQVLKVTTLKENCGVADLTIQQASDAGIIGKYCKGLLIENVDDTRTTGTVGLNLVGTRNATVRNCKWVQPMGFHSLIDSLISGNWAYGGLQLNVEGGCEYVHFVGNTITQIGTNGFNVQTQSQRVTITGNHILNVPNGGVGIQLLSDSGFGGSNVVVGNFISGGGVGDYGVAIGSGCNDNVVTANRVEGCDTGIATDAASTGQVVGNNRVVNCTTPYSLGAGSIADTGSAVYDPPNLADGAGVTTTVTVTGAAFGHYAEASFSNNLQGITLTAWVSAADTISVRFQNESGGALDLASGTLKATFRRT